ncbi:hypothetical protein A3J13_02625 [Candidatus Daviesbacteria bacterium RIFCSPLOWO2_02_FULL_36_8]|uniref:Uncharacterized protein n=1 Tax=Candidatus Daviesbacteria bacterium RIFCSPLOWO2_02_FULL_36_8 TaxID=1797793 RepID=A0A1F5MGK8_9BACT|nr:MAG: hypothetical protein A3J13_02625 [Candidatus Daviesbacteria bacterium RIFCSPLOWO2_02_FULL_36_8]
MIKQITNTETIDIAKKLLDKGLIDATKEFLNDGIDKKIDLWNNFVDAIIDQKITSPDEYLRGLWQRDILEHIMDVTEETSEETYQIKQAEKTLKQFAYESGAEKELLDQLSFTEEMFIRASIWKAIYDADKKLEKVLSNRDKIMAEYRNLQEKYPQDKYWWHYGLPQYLIDKVSQIKLDKYIVHANETGIFKCYPEFNLAGYTYKRVEYKDLDLPKNLQEAFIHWVSIYGKGLSSKSFGKYKGVDIDAMGIKLTKELKKYLSSDTELVYWNKYSEFSIIK